MRLPELFEEGRRFCVRTLAGHDDVPGLGRVIRYFEAGSFVSSIGNTVPLRVAGDQVGWARVVAAEVAADGTSVLFTYEVTKIFAPAARPGNDDDDSNDTE